jgi:hypothetical protein
MMMIWCGMAGVPVEVDEDEETIKIVQLVKSQDTLRNASSMCINSLRYPLSVTTRMPPRVCWERRRG